MDPTSSMAFRADDDDVHDVLGRVGRLVAHEADGQRLFDGVVEALGHNLQADASWLIHFDLDDAITILGVWSTHDLSLPVGTRQAISDELRALRESGQPYRVDLAELDPGSAFGEEARRLGIASAVGVPVWLAGQVWALAVVARFRPTRFPVGTETRMTTMIEPVTAALANAWTRARLEEWQSEQAALRRLAELAAAGPRSDELVRAVVDEASALLDGRAVIVARLEEDRLHGVVVATSDRDVPVGLRLAAEGDDATARALRSGHPERLDDRPRTQDGGLADQLGAVAVVAVPVEVEDRPWGVVVAVSPDEPLPVGTERRLSDFAEIAAAAITTAQTRERLQRITEEQAALLRVAQLVARGVAEEDLFDAVTTEAAGLIDNEATTLIRYDGGRTFTVLATRRGPSEAGAVFSVPADDVGTISEMLRTGRAARVDADETSPHWTFSPGAYEVGSSVSVPIVVEGELWGSLGTLTTLAGGERLPPNTEARLQKFADLVAAAIANSLARTEVVQLADEQSALRRVAELVARGAVLSDVFAGISVEASRLLAVGTALLRFEPDGCAEIVGVHKGRAQLGLRIRTTDAYIAEMFTAGQAARLAEYREAGFAAAVRDLGLRPGTAAPITVEGRIWGALKTSPSGAVLRPGAEKDMALRAADKLEKFAALAAAAIANAENRTQLTASRARIVAAADEARQRLQRDVHDGAQQRLVQTVLTLKLARNAAQVGGPTDDLVTEALGHAERATAELRDLVHGILPASLSRGGLRSGIESLIADLPVPVELDFAAPRLRASTEITAYFVVAEALTNVVKHASATHAEVGVGFRAGYVTIEVRDNGKGGADPTRGSGLTGLRDRVETAEGNLVVTSPPGGGTRLRALLPVERTAAGVTDDHLAPGGV